MAEHELIRRKILLVGGGILVCVALVVLGALLGDTLAAFWVLVLAVALGVLLCITSMRWIWRGIEAVTGLQFFIPTSLLFVGYMIGAMLSPIILPLGLVILTVQYVRAKKRFDREIAASGQTQ